MTVAPPYAVFSCDVDTVDRHLDGYGFEGLPACDLVYRTAVPRLLELWDELRVPGVLFIIGRDAGAQSGLLRQATAAGHEIASHSLTHPQPFRTLPDGALATEIEESRRALGAACGVEVAGFRAPAWDVDDRVLAGVKKAGYRYDASVFPTPVLIASRLAAYRRSIGKQSLFSMDLVGHAFAATRPHRLRGTAAGLVEFPIAVTRWLRLPVYHTFAYFTSRRLFTRLLDRALRSAGPLCYEFHAADLLDLTADGVDARMARHPGMNLPVREKRALLKSVLERIAATRQVVTYRTALEAGWA